MLNPDKSIFSQTGAGCFAVSAATRPRASSHALIHREERLGFRVPAISGVIHRAGEGDESPRVPKASDDDARRRGLRRETQAGSGGEALFGAADWTGKPSRSFRLSEVQTLLDCVGVDATLCS
jgi:hypothetical protein